MKKLITISSILVMVSLILSGCLTSTSVTPATGTTPATTNTVVNQANLALDTSVLQTAVSLVVPVIVKQDPSIVNALSTAQTVLNGVLTGASTNSVTQILTAIGQNNPAAASELAPLVNTVSGLEQTLLKKYGATVSGQIVVAIAIAVNNGITTGLANSK